MKGLFIPEITAEMFRNGCLESIEALMEEGEIYDIEYSKWIPISERLPEVNQYVADVCKYYLVQDRCGDMHVAHYQERGWESIESRLFIDVVAWMPLPESYKEESEDKV